MDNEWFKPAGLDRGILNNVEGIFKKESLSPSKIILDKVDIRRLHLKLYDSRMTPKYVKLTRRSRRRMRGKGGCWQYPPYLLKIYQDAFCKITGDNVES